MVFRKYAWVLGGRVLRPCHASTTCLLACAFSCHCFSFFMGLGETQANIRYNTPESPPEYGFSLRKHNKKNRMVVYEQQNRHGQSAGLG